MASAYSFYLGFTTTYLWDICVQIFLRVWKGEKQLVAETPNLIKCLRTLDECCEGDTCEGNQQVSPRSWAVCWDQERRCSQCGCALEAGNALQMKPWIHWHGCLCRGTGRIPMKLERGECLLREKLSDWEKGAGERLTFHCRSFFFF